MAQEQEQAPPSTTPTPDASDVETTDAGDAPAAEGQEAEAAHKPVDTDAPADGEVETEASATDDAPAAEATDETPADEAAAEDEEAPEPAEVSRLIEEAVEEASHEMQIPTGDAVTPDSGAATEEPMSMAATDLVRSEEAQGFTGDIMGRTVTLEELEAEERSHTEDPVYEQFRQLIDRTTTDLRELEIVQGRVLEVNDDDVIIDIGYKSDGIVSRDEFDRELKRGDTVEVWLERKEDRNGQLVLSKERADQERRWQRVEEAYENEDVLEGTIIRRIKGGMIVDLFEGLEAFLPGSQIDVRPVRDFDAYLEKRMEFKIVKLNPENENIVVSHRELIQAELEEQREQILSELEVGQVLQGTVKNIVDFGVFIDLGGVDGLLHITDLSWGRVSHPSEVVDLDEEIQVVVLDYEEERQRISLGLKQLQPHPWDNIGEKYDEGETVEGKVVSITNYGAFVELEKGIEGLVHISEMSWTRHIKHPSQMVSLGQLVEVKILNIDEEEKKISLGMKQLEPDPWDGISDRYPAGTVLTGTVRNITNFGVFVEIEPGIDGLVHISDLSWTKKVRHPSDMVKKGQEMDVVILNIDEDRRRISLGHKQVKTNPWDQFSEAYAEGNDTTGEVVRVEDKGLVVELPLDVEAFVPGSELKNGPRDFETFYRIGQELELRVIRFDKGRKDIVLSETAKDREEEQAERRQERHAERQEKREQKQAVRSYQQSQSSSESTGGPTTGPTTLGELSGLADLKAEMEEAERQTDEDTDAAGFDESAGFPDNFPHVSVLEGADINSVAELRAIDDFQSIKGIGEVYAGELEDALAAMDEARS
ncbi:30S ribosomal protein S1 [Salisaeta longa]|uniref:30S ribosomal protein S1 n=1 Tax=Salisaeta longa TaxID=503170 RepID=UPI0003F6D12E|nr:30S ribosomal protein S1 [Salisaeta longa]